MSSSYFGLCDAPLDLTSADNQTPSPASSAPSSVSPPSKRKGEPTPDHLKDENYWKRRAKNNDSAKRSRDKAKKRQEDNAKLIEALKKESEMLRIENAVLRSKISAFLATGG